MALDEYSNLHCMQAHSLNKLSLNKHTFQEARWDLRVAVFKVRLSDREEVQIQMGNIWHFEDQHFYLPTQSLRSRFK